MKGYIFGLISVFSWGTVFVISRFLIPNEIIDPIVLAFWRFFWASFFLLFVIKFNFKKIFIIFKKDLFRFLFLSISGIYLMSIFIFISVKTSSATISSVLMSSNPIFVILISILFLKEKITLEKILGVFIGFVGCAIVIKQDINIFYWVGEKVNIYALLAAISWAIYTVIGEKPTKKYGAVETTSVASFIGTIFLFLTVKLMNLNLWGKNLYGFLLGIYLGIFPTGIGFTLWFLALNYLKPFYLAPFQYLTPIITYILSIFILKENVSLIVFIGMFLIFFSLFLIQKKEWRKIVN
ncbi:MAG: DMT family transporter [Candidatus Omnitrophica bacterium]|nr:DMT family transporter [Candidatus Omnitrophota bacterium]MCM8803463.1 DMT family transporter [Candidatus Omnitrophota bacterium]